MKRNLIRFSGTFLIIFACAFVLIGNTNASRNIGEKISPVHLVAKHLQSIGTDEARRSSTSLMAIGTAKAVFG